MLNVMLSQGQVLCMSLLEEAVNDAEFIFEAVMEDLEIKRDLFESEDSIILSKLSAHVYIYNG